MHEHEPHPESHGEGSRELDRGIALDLVGHAADDRPVHRSHLSHRHEALRRIVPAAIRADPICAPRVATLRRWVRDLMVAPPDDRQPPVHTSLESTELGESMREPLITPAGLSRLTGELDRLKTAGRREIAATAQARDRHRGGSVRERRLSVRA